VGSDLTSRLNQFNEQKLKQEAFNNIEMGIDSWKKNFLTLREKGICQKMIEDLAFTKIGQLELGEDHHTTNRLLADTLVSR